MQEATQSTIVKKLSSHARNSKTKRALWEYNNIFMSLYILDFIEDPVLRSSIRRALNRIEAYHQLRRTIAKVHGGKFRGTTALENEVWNQCARLVANCIILYNTLMLSSLIEQH
jgi:TnpA family transposase